MIKTLIFLTFTLQLTSAATHSLQFFLTTVTPVISIPEFTAVGQVDAEQAEYYDSNNRTVVLKVSWLNKSDDAEHWEMKLHHAANQEAFSKSIMAVALKVFNQAEKGLHTLQTTIGCQLDDNGSRRGFAQFGYDGDDLLTLDLKSETWIAAVPQILPFINSSSSAQGTKQFILYQCIDCLLMYVEFGKSVLERKDPPEVSVFQKDSSSSVVCHATGFFPKAVMISWQKNGEELNEDVELRETLPNQDGTFQKRSILTLSPEELKNNNYTCVIQHSSLKKELVLLVSDHKVLSGNGVSVGLIVGVMVGALLLVIIICAAVFIWKRRSSGVSPDSVNFRSRVTPVSVSCISDSPTPSPCPDVVAA
ncbi:patr class I histocompatibility antigen, alpha chain G-like [Astyanax mexicanus]|uniref:Patr class I histocompatibility antigen, alpha chain G-like n=1 Tax=Astyanax mexicanus TaxID=7994 RepID=A0A8T2KUJ0_ASTMX|nr:patr class I histocompatibility antigen, alpha chain G-like [Astyanax mexicanus]